MTPTEQDEGLREKIHSALFADDFPILNDIEKDAVDRVVAIIQQDQKAERERVALEARLDEIERIDAANIDNGINFWFAHLKKQDSIENNNGWRTMRQYTPERIAELKAQQEEL